MNRTRAPCAQKNDSFLDNKRHNENVSLNQMTTKITSAFVMSKKNDNIQIRNKEKKKSNEFDIKENNHPNEKKRKKENKNK